MKIFLQRNKKLACVLAILIVIGGIWYTHEWQLPPNNIDAIENTLPFFQKVPLYVDEFLHPHTQRYVFLSDIRICERQKLTSQTLPVLSKKDEMPCTTDGFYFSTPYNAIYNGGANGLREVTTDVSHFQIFLENPEYGKDSQHVYMGFYEVMGADPDTFKILPEYELASPKNTWIGFDAHHVFYQDQLVPGIDPQGLPVRTLEKDITDDTYLAIGTDVYYLCAWDNEYVCPSGFGQYTPLKLIATNFTDSSLTIRGNNGTDNTYATDKAGNTYFRGVVYKGECGFNSITCFVPISSYK